MQTEPQSAKPPPNKHAPASAESPAISRIVDTLTEPQTAHARMRAGRGFEAEATVTVTPLGLLAVGGLVAATLLSVPPIVRASRKRFARPDPPRLNGLTNAHI